MDKYVEDLPAIIVGEVEDDPEISAGVATLPLKLIDLIWKQRAVFSEMGIAPMAEAPWDAKGANVVARSIATKMKGWIQPLPDEVAVPLLNRAAWYLGKPANQILALVEDLDADPLLNKATSAPEFEVSKRDADMKRRYVKRVREFLTLAKDEQGKSLIAISRLGRKGVRHRIPAVSDLIRTLVGACTVVLQSSTGIRSSEICALKCGLDPESQWPINVKLTLSSSGLYEIFTLTGLMSKSETEPVEVEWLLAMRPVGSTDVPLPVRAIQVLDRLLAGARRSSGSDDLLICWHFGPGMGQSSRETSDFNNMHLNNYTKNFIVREVDLSNLPNESKHRVSPDDLVPWRETRGGNLRPHQFRPTYAHFVLAVDARLLPSVQRQFHHMSMAMTEQGYWGANRLQIEPLDAVSQQMVARRLFELATGRSIAAGKRGEQLQRQLDEITWLIEGKGMEQGWREVLKFVKGNHVDMWFAEHGDCFPTGAGHMECHKRAGSRPLSRLVPNYETRDPTLCSGCRCYIVDKRHRGFHETRMVDNLRAANDSNESNKGLARIAAARASASRKLLAAIGATEEELALLETRATVKQSYAA